MKVLHQVSIVYMPYLSSRTESIGSTPEVSTTCSWSANRMASCKHSRPCLVRKSTKASRSSLSTRSAGIWADCRVYSIEKSNRVTTKTTVSWTTFCCEILYVDCEGMPTFCHAEVTSVSFQNGNLNVLLRKRKVCV